jgi:tetratricopeptide (TPR) repeat protein
MPDTTELMQRGAAAYEAGDFAAAAAAWEEAAGLGDPAAADLLRLVASGDQRRQVLWGRLAERDNAAALWSLGVAAVERADLPGVREHWGQAVDLDTTLAAELAGLLDCPVEAAAATIREADDGALACRLGELCHATGREDTACVWWVLARDAGSADAAALLERVFRDSL